jgi:hypothetical protein
MSLVVVQETASALYTILFQICNAEYESLSIGLASGSAGFIFFDSDLVNRHALSCRRVAVILKSVTGSLTVVGICCGGRFFPDRSLLKKNIIG